MVWECLGVNSELGVLLIENVIVGLLNFTPPPPPDTEFDAELLLLSSFIPINKPTKITGMVEYLTIYEDNLIKYKLFNLFIFTGYLKFKFDDLLPIIIKFG